MFLPKLIIMRMRIRRVKRRTRMKMKKTRLKMRKYLHERGK